MNPRNGQCAAGIIATGLALVVVWSLALRFIPFRAHLAESNYESNLIRLQQSLLGPPPPAALVGSSITGRLLPEYFGGTAVSHVANLGLDGSGPLLGMELLSGHGPLPPVVVVEANLLMVPEGENDKVLRDAAAGFGFRLAGHAEALRAETRPTSLLYAWLKRRKDERAAVVAGVSGGVRSEQEVRLDRNTPAELEAHREKVFEAFRKALASGSRLILIRYPTASSVVQESFHPLDFTGTLATNLSVRRIDLGRELRARGHEPQFTDGTHLSAASARVAAGVVAEAIGGEMGK